MEPVVRKETKGNVEEGFPEADKLLNKDRTEQEEEEEKGANCGILNNLISNMMGATTIVDDKSGENIQKSECERDEEKGANGGILNNLISNLMGATTTIDDKSGENIQKSECEDEDEDEKKQESPGGGILEKIMSHLPEDAVPTTEEASILIHSAID